MDLDLIKEAIEANVYHIPSDRKVPHHRHEDRDEVFYCIKGTGFGILENEEVELNIGDSFTAPAGKLHSLRSDDELYVVAVLIPVNRIICHCKQVRYVDIKKAMVAGARTFEEVKEMTGAGTGCGGCANEIERILSIACGCENISMDTVINAVRDGADTVEKLEEATGAGNGCGRCKLLLQNVIDNKR